MPEHHHDELRGKLRSAAGEYEPDTARIRARVERGMADPGSVDVAHAGRHRARAWLRPVGAAVAVAGVLAAAGVSATAALRQDDGPQQPSAATSAPESQSPTSDPTPSKTGRRSMPPAPPASSDAASRSPERPSKSSSDDTKEAEKAYADGPLWTDGSINSGSGEYWSQSDVTLKTQRTLTKVTIELRLARTEGLSSTGSWCTLPEDDFDIEVEEEDDYLVYRWTLKDGRSIPPGDHVFAGQYDHPDGARDAGKDDYSAAGVAPGDDELSVEGDFHPRED